MASAVLEKSGKTLADVLHELGGGAMDARFHQVLEREAAIPGG